MNYRTQIWIISLLVLAAAIVIFDRYYPNNYASPTPSFSLVALRNEAALLEEVKAGSVKAGNELAEAYLFESNKERAQEILRLVLVKNDDTETELRLGVLLLNSAMKNIEQGKSPNEKEVSEGLALLRLAATKGSQEAREILAIYEKKSRDQ